jgi:hypothetical protein
MTLFFFPLFFFIFFNLKGGFLNFWSLIFWVFLLWGMAKVLECMMVFLLFLCKRWGFMVRLGL